jgi:hypothetical protein
MTGEHDRGNASMLAGQDCYRDEDGARFAGPIGEKSPFHQLLRATPGDGDTAIAQRCYGCIK